MKRGASKLSWGGGAQRSILHFNEHKKTGARSTRARSAPKIEDHFVLNFSYEVILQSIGGIRNSIL
jgi:hypothetical protein